MRIASNTSAAQQGNSLHLLDAAGTPVLQYQGLIAFDARGRHLPVRLELAGQRLLLRADDRGAVYPVTIDPFIQQAYLKASNTNELDGFGWSIAIDGDTIVVGALSEDGNTISEGAAYVFTRSGGVWSQQAYLKGSNTQAGDTFGMSVAIDGDTIVVGASTEDSNAAGVNGDQSDNSLSRAGAAYVFTRSGGVWSQQAYLKASNPGQEDEFGWSVDIDADTIIVGAHWEDSNASGVNGDQSDNSANDTGAAYIFTRSGGVWSQQAYLKASNPDRQDFFGSSVAISGNTAVVGAYRESSNASGVNGDQSDNSASLSGAAYVFTRSGGVWSQQAYLKASNPGQEDEFGSSVAIIGDSILVGARSEDSSASGINGDQSDNSADDAGAAYIFTRSGVTWSQQAYLKASNPDAGDLFGYSVAIDGDSILVGARSEDSSASGVNGDQNDNSADDAGAAYIFTRSGGTWNQQAYLKASNPDVEDSFGFSVAISGDSTVVGAIWEDSNATGVNGDQANNDARNSGAAYVFALDPILTVELSASSASSLEGDSGTGPAALNLLVSGGLTFTPRSIELVLTDGSATLADSDYSQTNASISIPPGDYSSPQTLAIPLEALGIVGDALVEADESLNLTLQNPGPNLQIGDADGDAVVNDSASYSILNDDAAPTASPSPTLTLAPPIDSGPAPSIGIFDPAISKLGYLVPGQAGVTGEQLEWVVTVSNRGNVPGTNLVITDEVNPALRVNEVEAPVGISAGVSGQTVIVTIPLLNPGQSVSFSIFTTTLRGATVQNSACLTAEGLPTPRCATGQAVQQLPATGEAPAWRDWLLATLMGGLLLGLFCVGLGWSRRLSD